MDGLNAQTMRRLLAHQVKRLEPGTFVSIYDEGNNMITRCRLVQYGREKRLQSLDRLNLYFRIKDDPRHVYLVE